MHPTPCAFRRSVPDRRDLRARTCNLRDQIGAPIPLLRTLSWSFYDLYNGIRQSRNAAGNERPTFCPGLPPPRMAIRKDPLSFPPVSSPDIDGAHPVEDAPGILRRLIDLSVLRAAFTYPPPSLPLAHTMVPSSPGAGGYPICRRSGDPSNQGTWFTDCDPSSLILLLSPG